jgi:hypothetical protein
MRAKIEVPHAKDCAAVRHAANGSWVTAWGPLDSVRPYALRDKMLRRGNGYTSCLRFACNDPRCPARMLVAADDVCVAADDALAGKGEG